MALPKAGGSCDPAGFENKECTAEGAVHCALQGTETVI